MNKDVFTQSLKSHLKRLGYNQEQLSKMLDVSQPYISALVSGKKPFGKETAEKWQQTLGFSAGWLLTGEGPMLVHNSVNDLVNTSNASAPAPSPSPSSTEEKTARVPLIPFEARGGQLDGFARNGVTLAQCETVPTPFKGAQFAISVRGQSMSPTYPSGCVLFISKNIADWVEWGKVYVLDTENGVIVKQLAPSTLGEDFVCCKSFNDAPEFAPFNVPKASIFGIYRVVGALIET